MIPAEHVLLVSDHPGDTSRIQECLIESFPGVHLSVAASLAEAIELLKIDLPDILIADINISEEKVLRDLAAFCQDPLCPALILCDMQDQAASLDVFKAAPVDFIIRPSAGNQELSMRIDRLLCSWQMTLENRDVEKRLRKSEETLRQILNLVPHHIHAKDASGRFIMANKAVAESYHMTPEQFVGMSHLDIAMDRDEALGMLRDDREVMETGCPKHIPEETCIDADGNVHWLETTKVPFENDGEPAVLVVANDITERKRAEFLSEMQRDIASGLAAAMTMDEAVDACLKAALRISSVDRIGIYLCREEGGLDLAGQASRLQGASPMLMGYPSHSDLFRAILKGRSVYSMEDIEGAHADAASTGSSSDLAVIPILHENKAMACMIAGCGPGKGPVPLSDRPSLEAIAAQAGIGFLRLRAEERLRKTEAQFLQAQKMEAVGHLAGGVAHDFNNLLSVILGYTELSRLNLQIDPDTVKDNYLNQVLGAGKRAQDLVHQLLAFSRKQVLEMKTTDLNSIIRDLKKIIHRLIGEHILLETDLSENLWPVRVDTTQMGQILINLAVNARDAMPDGGTLFIQTANLAGPFTADDFFQNAEGGEWIRLMVRDNGEGMDKSILARAFEPFFTTKGQNKGTGLGLSTVYGIVKQHNGQIRMESSPGQGTIFTILLPRSRETAYEASVPTALPPRNRQRRGGETLLLVEDESVVRTMAEEILRKQGYKILSAGSGAEALEIVQTCQGTIDLLITDVIMPGMNGRELYRHLSGIIPGLRVIYFSGYDGDIISRHGVLEPGINFLRKPFNLEIFNEAIREVLDGKAAR